MQPLVLALLLLCGAAFAACSQGGGQVVRAPQTVVCSELIPAPPAMLSPVNGATGVPDGNFALILSDAFPGTIELTATGSAAVSLPSPAPTTSGSDANAESYAVPVLQAATSYTVLGLFGSGSCQTQTRIGSFTTR